MLLELALLFQALPEQYNWERHIRESRQQIERMRESQDIVTMELAKQRDAQYRAKLLEERQSDFIQKFNKYYVKNRQGIRDQKLLDDTVRAWNKLRKTEGFEVAFNNSCRD